MTHTLPAVLTALLLTANPLAAQDKEPAPAVPPKAKLQTLTVYPAAVHLEGPRDLQRLGVLGSHADGRGWDLSRDAKFTSADPKTIPTIAVVEEVDRRREFHPLPDRRG